MKKHPVPLYVAEAIASKRRLICIGGHFHEYDGGVYRRREHWVLERDAIAHIRKEARRSILGDIIKVLEVQTSVAPESIYQSGRIINLQNGLLELGKGLRSHDPKFLSTTQIPIDFDPEASCATWERCLADWVPGESDVIELLQEWFGYCLVPDASQHKAVILIGDGANGKSVLCHVLKALAGHENVSAVSLNALSKSFSLAELFGKLVNLSVEAEVREGIEEGIFKQVVAGDPVQAERKYKDPFVFRPYARFTIATNNLFPVNDHSDGFYRRLLIVRFNACIPEDEQDRGLGEKLEGELPGILNWSLVGLARLDERGRFLIPQRVQDEVSAFRRSPQLPCSILGRGERRYGAPSVDFGGRCLRFLQGVDWRQRSQSHGVKQIRDGAAPD